MNNKDFQNGFALGLASGGVVEVGIPAKEEQEKTITITENGTTEILPDTDKALSKVTVVTNVPIGGGATLNIAYGETAPEDTSKLWVRANEPAYVLVSSDFEGVESITTLNFLPKGMSKVSCARVGNKIYLFGGLSSSYLNTINVFDTETNNITTLTTTLPSGCNNMGCAAVGTKVYLFGGHTGSSYLNTINVFDTETEELTTITTTLPSGRNSMGCAAVGTKVYLFGGYDGRSYLNTINVFDTETKGITTLTTTLPYRYSYMGCAAVGTKICLFGGVSSSRLNTINVFDTETNNITTLTTTLPYAYSHMGCAAVGNNVYLFGGHTGSSYLNTIEKFTLPHELANGDIGIQIGLLNNKFNIINVDKSQIEIGVENVYIGNVNNEAEPVSAYLYNGTEWKQISYGTETTV